MQLTKRRQGRIGPALGLLTANLFAAVGAHAQEARPTPLPPVATSHNDDTASDLGVSRLDTSVLFYQEAGGRVRATEPVASVTVNGKAGEVLSIKLTSDILTGATPNGATPSKFSQTFEARSSTGASGDNTIAPHALPVDPGFRDRRFAADAGYSFLWNSDTRLSVGGGLSREIDYRSYSINAGLARDFNRKNTTVGLSVDLEFDQSRPLFGTPAPLVPIDGVDPLGGPSTKRVTSLVAGVTQVINRNWLAQLNYSYGDVSGYQTDPYRYVSLVDKTGEPVQYLYEGRPRSRKRHSVYLGSKVALGPTVLDFSVRAYQDSWGIKSGTFQAADRIPLGWRVYVEPMVRYYSQTAADFFRYYLVLGQPLPSYASPDERLSKFSAVTAGAKLAIGLRRTDEFYIQANYYVQMGARRPPDAIGDLAHEDLFAGVKAVSIMVGYSFAYE